MIGGRVVSFFRPRIRRKDDAAPLGGHDHRVVLDRGNKGGPEEVEPEEAIAAEADPKRAMFYLPSGSMLSGVLIDGVDEVERARRQED